MGAGLSRPRRPLAALVLAVSLLAAACSSGDADLAREDETSTTALPSETATTSSGPATSSTTSTAPVNVPPLPGDGTLRAVVSPTGVTLRVPSGATVGPDGLVDVITPCGRSARAEAVEQLTGAHVVLDPGHGGSEPGAVGPGGLTEKELNLAVALHAKTALEERGFTVGLTRGSDYRIPLVERTEIAKALDALAFVSLHHNAEPDESRPTPGTETYYQISNDESKRLAGIIYEDVFAALSTIEGVEWAADFDAGAKFRLNSSGGDYYGILRRSAPIPAVLAEFSFVSNPAEEELLRTVEIQRLEGEALARAITRFLTGDDPGSGFTDPYPRSAPAGGGGGSQDCEDPLL